MPKERYYLPQEFTLNELVSLEGTECHHLTNVMRSSIGDSAELVNGMGCCARASITKFEKKSVTLLVESLHTETKDPHTIILAQGMTRPNKLDFIIEKGTELGMDALWLFPTQASEKKELSKTQLERLHFLAIAAMKQCGRLFLPEIIVMPPLAKWSPPSLPFYFGSLDPDAPLLVKALQKTSPRQAIFCVGPEGGFSATEIDTLIKLGAMGTKLHPNILRAETAAITAIALISHQFSYI